MRDLVGIPFVTGGRGFQGMDCLGLVTEGLRRLGIPWRDPWARVADAWTRGERPIAQAIPEGWIELPASTHLLRGDVVLSMAAGLPSHVSLALGAGELLHTTQHTGSSIVRERALRSHIVAVFRRGPA